MGEPVQAAGTGIRRKNTGTFGGMLEKMTEKNNDFKKLSCKM